MGYCTRVGASEARGEEEEEGTVYVRGSLYNEEERWRRRKEQGKPVIVQVMSCILLWSFYSGTRSGIAPVFKPLYDEKHCI
jgi:hypothetical protein